LKALEEESVPIDMIAGASMGALIGAYYAKERDAALLEELALGVNWRRLVNLIDPNLILLWKGFVQGQKVKSFLRSVIGDVKFEDLAIPFAVVATDVESMEEIVINEGSVVEGVRASISMPVIFTPVRWGNRFLTDGGVVNPVPVDVVQNMGADVIIAVNVLAVAQQRKQNDSTKEESNPAPTPHPESAHLASVKKRIDSLLHENKDKIKIFDELSHIARTKIFTGRGKVDPKTPNIFDVLMQSIHAMEYEIVKLTISAAHTVIYPDVSHIGTFEFYKGEEAISEGYKATKAVLPKLQEMIHC
jgi:Predicted esterase of the alpha-beta hydrolase superfamily